MFSKTIFVLAIVCVVNASVLTDNVFDVDDPDTEVASNPKGCNVQECDQRCRRLKFHGGACVKGSCKCDNFLNAEDVDSENSVSDLENSVLQQVIDDPETEVKAGPRLCNVKLCDWLCRCVNKTSGSCINGRCKCEKSAIAEVTDDPETEVKAGPRLCNVKLCDWLCRCLNKTSGSCINGRCKCEKSAIAEVTDDPETEIKAGPSRCNVKLCDWVCRCLNKTSGSCTNGRCKCEKSAIAEDNLKTDVSTSTRKCNNRACNQFCLSGYFISGSCVGGRCQYDLETEVQNKKDDCNPQECDQRCRRLKFRGGACVKGRCKCDNYLNAEDTMTDSAATLSLRSCNSMACDDQCRRTGWHSGVCVKGVCKCDYFLNTEFDAVPVNSLSNLEDSVSPKRCTPDACTAFCHKHQFREGICNGARCRCSNYSPTPKDAMNDFVEPISLDDNFLTENSLSTEDAVDEYSALDTKRVCRLTKCNRACNRRGYENATCVKGRCKCYNISKTPLPVSELSEDQVERGCNQQACNQLCRSLKFHGGACVNDRCKCDNFFEREVDAVDNYSELATRRVCHLRQCNRTCTLRGYETSRCLNGWCKCRNKIQTEASSLNDVINDENEKSNDILRTNEEELIGPAPSPCNASTCYTQCRRLKYAGGWCRLGHCECF